MLNLKSILIFLSSIIVCQNFIGQVELDFGVGNTFASHELQSARPETEMNSITSGISYIPKKFGLRIGFSIHEYFTNSNFINSIQQSNLINLRGDNAYNSQFFSFGPVFKIGEKRLNLNLSPNIRYGLIKVPERIYKLDNTEEGQLVYSDNNEGSSLDGNSLFSSLDLKINYRFTKRTSLNIGGSFITNRYLGDGNSIIYRNTENFSQEAVENGQLIQLDCESHDLWNVSVGISIALGNKDKSPSKDEQEDYSEVQPPKPVYPENQAEISKNQADSLVLDWIHENPEVKYATYIIQLFQINEENDSLILAEKIKRKRQLDLTKENVFKVGNSYAWVVTATNHKDLKNCVNDCVSERFEFIVLQEIIPQFFEPLNKDIGNYVTVSDILRFELPNAFVKGGEVKFYVLEENGSSKKDRRILTEDSSVKEEFKNQFVLQISELASGKPYTLVITNGERTKYLRFIKAGHEKQN